MPSIILSDNGVSSGSAGLKSTAASDGALALQTTTAGGTATTAVYVDTSQLVGLGTTPAAKLHLLTTGNTTADGVRLTLGSEGRSHNIYSALATGRDLTIAPYRSLTINTGSGTNEGVVTLNAYEYTVFGTGSSYTERMRLDASGNLGIGISSFAAKLNVQVGAVTTLGAQASSGLFISGGGSNNNLCQIALGYGTTYAPVAISSITTTQTGNTIADLIFATRSVNTDTAPSERARITSSGEFLVGKTSFNTGVVGFMTRADGLTSSTRSASTNSDTTWDVYSTGAANYRFYVGMGGTVYATNTTISSISDIRFKENVRDLNVGLAEIMALKPRLYDWKEGKGADIKNARGFIAQEFEEVFPDLIDEWKDPAPDGEEPYKSVRADLIPVLVKAIQELKAELDTAKAEIAALKGTQP